MSTELSTPDTIILIHGLWMTPRSWDHWIAHYDSRGYRVIAPAYPGLEVEVEALRADPSPIEAVTVEHLQALIGELDRPPIIMGHSFGGAITQVLLDRGHGAAGVAIDSVPTGGVRVLPPSQIKATFPVLHNPANRHKAVGLTPDQFHYAFTNTLSEQESARVYERYHIPAPGSWVWGGVLANLTPGHRDTWVNYHNDDRAPLLFIAGGDDHIMPPSVNKSNAKHYDKSGAVTEYKEFAGRSHFTWARTDGRTSRLRPLVGHRQRDHAAGAAGLTRRSPPPRRSWARQPGRAQQRLEGRHAAAGHSPHHRDLRSASPAAPARAHARPA